MKNKFNYDGNYSKLYYSTTSKDNAKFENDFRFKEILKFVSKDDILCDFGCGDASKLVLFKHYAKELWGFDQSKNAIDKARKKYPTMKLFVADTATKLPSNKFDITISTYTLEHVENPEKFIKEMIRVTKKGGYIVNLCPNFGSPLFPSPPEIIDKNILKRVLLVLSRISLYKNNYKTKIYKSINPIIDRPWKPDYDTISEISLAKVVKKYKNKIVFASSFWQTWPIFYIPFFALALFHINPIKYWGGDCFFVIKK